MLSVSHAGSADGRGRDLGNIGRTEIVDIELHRLLGILGLDMHCWIAKDIVVLLVICRIAAPHDIALGPGGEPVPRRR